MNANPYSLARLRVSRMSLHGRKDATSRPNVHSLLPLQGTVGGLTKLNMVLWLAHKEACFPRATRESNCGLRLLATSLQPVVSCT